MFFAVFQLGKQPDLIKHREMSVSCLLERVRLLEKEVAVLKQIKRLKSVTKRSPVKKKLKNE
jgi:hypothetical protein